MTNLSKTVWVDHYTNVGRFAYEIDLQSHSVAKLESKTRPDLQMSGFGQFVRLRRFAKDKEFVAMFVLDKAIYLLIGKSLHLIGDDSEVGIVREKLSSFRLICSCKRRFEFYENGQIKTFLEYVHSGPNFWEEDDGDIFWWIDRELKTHQRRQGFLSFWPRGQDV